MGSGVGFSWGWSVHDRQSRSKFGTDSVEISHKELFDAIKIWTFALSLRGCCEHHSISGKRRGYHVEEASGWASLCKKLDKGAGAREK